MPLIPPKPTAPQGIEGLGEDRTEYVVVSNTPRQTCGNCEHFVAKESGCDGPKMKKFSRLQRLKDGNVLVQIGGHCKFWEEV